MIRKILPHPLLSTLLLLVWMLLANEPTLGNAVLGAILGIIIPIATEPFWPGRPKLRRPWRIPEYLAVAIWDILVANVEVAWIIITKRNEDMKPTWICVPLDLVTPEAITVLAGTITLTPGTLTADLSDEGHSLLVHCLDTDDPNGVRDEIKHRYERRLKEIFE